MSKLSPQNDLDKLISSFAKAIKDEVIELGYNSPRHEVQPNFTIFKGLLLDTIEKRLPKNHKVDPIGNQDYRFCMGYNEALEDVRKAIYEQQ